MAAGGAFAGSCDAEFVEEGLVSGGYGVVVDGSGDALAGDGLDVGRGRSCDDAGSGVFDNSAGERVLGALLEGGGEGDEFGFRDAGGVDGGDARLAFGEGSRFVEEDGVDASEALDAFSALEENAELGGAADGDGESRRDGESHGAGAGNDEDGDGDGEGAAGASRGTGEGPDDEGEGSNREDDGHKDGADAVGELLHGSFRGLRLLHEPQHLAEDAVGADGSGPVFEDAFVVEGATDDAIAGGARDGDRLTGDQRFIDAAGAGDNDAVDRDAFAGASDYGFAGDKGCDRSFDFDAVADHMRGLRLQCGEGAEGVEGAARGARLQPIAEQQEAKDEQHGVVVDVGVQAVLREEGGEESRGYGIQEGSAGAEGNQRVHGRGAVQRSLQSALVDDSARPDHADEGDAEHDVFERRNGNAVERWEGLHGQGVEHAGAVHERHRQQHGHRAADNRGEGLDANQTLLSRIGLMYVIVLVDMFVLG